MTSKERAQGERVWCGRGKGDSSTLARWIFSYPRPGKADLCSCPEGGSPNICQDVPWSGQRCLLGKSMTALSIYMMLLKGVNPNKTVYSQAHRASKVRELKKQVTYPMNRQKSTFPCRANDPFTFSTYYFSLISMN